MDCPCRWELWLGRAGGEETSRSEGSPREAARPRTRRAREAPRVEKPFESPPPPSRTCAAAGQQLEGRGRAGLILNRRLALVCLSPGTHSCTVLGKALFQMAVPTSPPARGAQPPAGSPFRRAGFPGQDSGRRTPPPPGASLPVVWKRRQSWWGCPPLLGRRIVQTCPPPRAWGLPWNVPWAPGPQPAFLALRASPASENPPKSW